MKGKGRMRRRSRSPNLRRETRRFAAAVDFDAVVEFVVDEYSQVVKKIEPGLRRRKKKKENLD